MLWLVPDAVLRFTLWVVMRAVYRIRIVGGEHLPFRGPALLVCNHVSLVDGPLVGATVPRFVRFMVYRPIYETQPLTWLFRLMRAIPVEGGNATRVAESIAHARRELEAGHVVCIFAEGAITRTGHLLPFKRGFERIVAGLDVPIIPVYLDGLWGSIYSGRAQAGQGRAHVGILRSALHGRGRLRRPVTVALGSPLAATARAEDVRLAVQELGAEAMAHRSLGKEVLQRRFLRTARRRFFTFCMADSTGKELTWGRALGASLLLSRSIRRHAAGERMVGVMLPSSVGAALANVGVMLAGKVPVNLNFTAGPEAVTSAVEQCGIASILTSRTLLARARLEPSPSMRFLEDMAQAHSARNRLAAMLAAALLPWRALDRLFNHGARDVDTLATVIFSSGSTGSPKGVMLSHRNLLANIEAMAQVFRVTPADRMMGVLPFFHSFGFTGTLWFPLVCGFGAIYHANPTEASTIGRLARKHRASLMISTPTFFGEYAKRCVTEDFASLRYAVAGAEPLREPIANAFQTKFGIDLLEGYGATEMSPAISVNVPDGPDGQTGHKRGTVGHPLPGVAAIVVDPVTRERLAPGTEGLLLVKGPNRMLGYLGQPEKTREVVRDGWYETGDVATIDEGGFIRITDRLARFTKIAGEMVPHGRVEEAIARALEGASCVVTATVDEGKGERLVAFYTKKDVSPGELWERLSKTELPRLWLPRREHLARIDAIPMLGAGKVDHRWVKTLAVELMAAQARGRGIAA